VNVVVRKLSEVDRRVDRIDRNWDMCHFCVVKIFDGWGQVRLTDRMGAMTA